MDIEINIFRDPPTQAEIDRALRADRTTLTTGEEIALGPGIMGIEVLVGAAVDAFNGQSNFMTGKVSAWDAQPDAVDWDWSKSIFAESYVKKVRAMSRDLVRCEVTALQRQIQLEGRAVDVIKDAVEIVGNVAGALVSRTSSKK